MLNYQVMTEVETRFSRLGFVLIYLTYKTYCSIQYLNNNNNNNNNNCVHQRRTPANCVVLMEITLEGFIDRSQGDQL